MKVFKLLKKVSIPQGVMAGLIVLGLIASSICYGFTWRFQTPLNPNDEGVKLWKMFIDEVTKATGGQLTFELLAGGASGISMPQYMDAYAENLVECGDILPQLYPAQLGKWIEMLGLTGWIFTDPRSVIILKDELRSKYENALKKNGVILLAFINAVMTADGAAPIFSKKEITKLADLKGLRLRGPGGGGIQEEYIWRKLGVNMLNIPISEVYIAMSRGLCDAAKSGTQRLLALRLDEICRYIYIDSYAGSFTPSCIVCSAKAFDTLPEDLRRKVVESGKKIEELFWNTIYFDPHKLGFKSEIDALEEARKKGMKVSMLPDEVLKEIISLAEMGIQDLANKYGADGQYVYSIIKSAKQRYPQINSALYDYVKSLR